MLVILGLLDLWTGLLIIPIQFGWVNQYVIVLHSIYLFAKGYLYWGDLFSLFDILVSIYLLFMSFGVTYFLFTILSVVYLLFKSAMSLKSEG